MKHVHEFAVPSELPFNVVRSVEGHFSIWRSDRRPPPGWREEAFCGCRQDCIDYIDGVWADPRLMRAASEADVTGIIE